MRLFSYVAIKIIKKVIVIVVHNYSEYIEIN